MNIAVLMTCHNRRETTLRCLASLFVAAKQAEKKDGAGQWRLHIFLVDDGSTDGTGEAVRKWAGSIIQHASFVHLHLILGSGSLYWAKGMALAWREALKWEALRRGECALQSFDPPVFKFAHYLWLNDDVELFPDALLTLIHDGKSVSENLRSAVDGHYVIVGSCRDGDGQLSYGATDEKNKLMSPRGQPVRAQGWFSGNVVLVPGCVCELVGIIDESYSHARADFDYAERLKKAGIPFFVASTYVGRCTCDWNDKMRGRSLWARLASLWRPGYCNLHDLWLIRSRYHGKVCALISCLHMIALVFRRVR